MKKGSIRAIEKPSQEMLDNFPKPCWYFREQPEMISIGEIPLTVDKIGLPNQYGRIFCKAREIRWEGDRFWLAEETGDGEFEIRKKKTGEEETEIVLRADGQDEYKLIKAVRYAKDGVVVYTRFREAIIKKEAVK